jgi:hypothetical protein
MNKDIKIRDMIVSVEYEYNKHEEYEITAVEKFENSFEFLAGSLKHRCLQEFKGFSDTDTIINFYQQSHERQLEIISAMLLEDDYFYDEYVDQLVLDENHHQSMLEDCKENY